MGFEADYVFSRQAGGHELFSRNIESDLQPGHRRQLPHHGMPTRSIPTGRVLAVFFGRPAGLPLLQTGFTKRFGDGGRRRRRTCFRDVGRNPPPDARLHARDPRYGRRTALAVGDQRHRLVLNGIFETGYGFQFSGIYFYGSGQRFSTTLWRRSATAGAEPDNRLRPNGSIVPRNDFVGEPIHRVDLRIQRRFPLGGSRSIDALLRCSTCSTATTMEAGSPTKRTRITEGRIRIPPSRTSRAWRRSGSASRSETY